MTAHRKVYAAEQDAIIGGRENRPRCPTCGRIPYHDADAAMVSGYRYRCKNYACPDVRKTVEGVGHASGERHYLYGNPGPDHHNWVGQAISYGGAHVRRLRLYGSANDHACVDCGDDSGQGHEWSYTYACPNERVQVGGREHGLTYCACDDAEHYAARCADPCHGAYDQTQRVTRLADTA